MNEPLFIAERLADGGTLDPEALAWLSQGLKRYLRGDAPLDVCLRLTASNKIATRNRALLRAAGILDAGRNMPAWELAELLAKAVNRFESVTWPRIQQGMQDTLTPLQTALRDAFATGAKPLTSRRRLYDLLHCHAE
jgi:hypothetical protein